MIEAIERGKPGEGEVHLWVVFQAEASDPALLDRYRELLTEEEREKGARFYFEKHRTQYVLTRALVRTVLSGYSGVDPRAWRFGAGEHGRPEIASPSELSSLSFNLAHTEGLIVCACADPGLVGVDAERVRLDKDLLDIADRYFSPTEFASLRAQPPEVRPERFLYYWTLKESYIKAIGTGLATPLDRFSFGIGPAGELSLSFNGLADDPQHWQHWLLKPAAEHLIAVSAKRLASKAQRIVTRRVVPLAADEPLECEIVAQSPEPLAS
jgi:4'-phosphopantetheinyl transferase